MTTTTTKQSVRSLAALYTWVSNPQPPTAIFDVLLALTNDDLIAAMTSRNVGITAAGRIAWLEYGRRMGFHDFDVKVTSTDEVVDLSFKAKGAPLHTAPIFGVDRDGED